MPNTEYHRWRAPARCIPLPFMNVVVGTASMLCILTMASMSVFAIAVLATDAGPTLGLDPGFIGPFTSGIYLFAALTGTVTGELIRRFGAIRVCQLSMLASAAGLLAFASGSALALLPAAIALGLSYGPFNPASAHVLAGLVTDRSRPFVFSVKQLGVPVGGMLAGALVPGLALALGWQQAVLVLAVAAVLVAGCVQPLRNGFDGNDGARRMAGGSGLRACLGMVLGDPVLRRYSLVALAYAGCQLSTGAFLVVYLNGSVGLDVVRAGIALAFMQAGGVLGRLLWGALASRYFSTRAVLASIGSMTALCLVLITSIDAGTAFATISALSLVLGFSSFGWNGVMLSQIATLAPAGRAADATGGMQFVMFGGIVIFPTGVTAAVSVSGSYTAPFLGLALLAATGALAVRRARGKHGP